MRANVVWLGAVVVLLSACAGATVVAVPGPRAHPADAAAEVPAFRPAPDPLFAEAPPEPHAESTAPQQGGHGGGHGHGSGHGDGSSHEQHAPQDVR